MFEITKDSVKINDVPTDVFGREASCRSACLLVEAGTTGYRGLDKPREESARTYISLKSLDGDFWFRPIREGDGEIAGFRIAGCGDDCLETLIKAADFISKALHEQRARLDD